MAASHVQVAGHSAFTFEHLFEVYGKAARTSKETPGTKSANTVDVGLPKLSREILFGVSVVFRPGRVVRILKCWLVGFRDAGLRTNLSAFRSYVVIDQFPVHQVPERSLKIRFAERHRRERTHAAEEMADETVVAQPIRIECGHHPNRASLGEIGRAGDMLLLRDDI